MDESRKVWCKPELSATTVSEALGPSAASGPMQKGLIAETETPSRQLLGPTGPTGPTGLFGPPPWNGMKGPPVPSDSRLKEDIVATGAMANGLPLYTFRYRGQQDRFEGVMAQDVLRIRPDAVVTSPDGYLLVDYAGLGLKLRRLQ